MTSGPDPHGVEWLVEKVRDLQEKLDGVGKAREKDENLVRRYSGQPTLQHQEKGKIMKTRYYGRGHFLHGAWLVSIPSLCGFVYLALLSSMKLAMTSSIPTSHSTLSFSFCYL